MNKRAEIQAPEGMAQIEDLAKGYADSRELLSATMAALTEERDAVTKKYLKRIRDQVAIAKVRKADLRAAIEGAPELFEKPKSRTLHGVKVGYRKATGKIEFEDADQVVKLIRKHFADRFDELVKVTEKPIKDALERMEAGELKKLGIEVTGTGDVVFISNADSEIDKLVAALLKDDTEGEAA